ncbi:hypothetical protein ATK36_2873 [Amycolatopsis sulphurea]|uniref:Mce-associated membrane protein n=1 Tax=Amycolatopsis sulphurea TaxID=76022 RepID=A0A2A9F9H2_9PSEU|nr:hypothetical protein [Amycolatopsis sulphurea]PFG47818.1 hypothetical protein ATK36_2873 [Amycolatopsis sulphurea]
MRRAATASLAAVLLTAGCSSGNIGAPADAPKVTNLAFVNAGESTAAVDGVKQAVEKAFSYDSAKPDEVAMTEQEYLTGAARTQFDQTFAEVRTSPVTTKTQVLETGLAELHPGRAKVLAVVAQHSTTPDGKQNSATAVMVLTAVPGNGHWVLQDLDFDPRGPLVQPDGPGLGPATTRDQVVAAAQRDGQVLLTVDAKNADAVYDRYETVAAEPLLTQFRSSRDETLSHLRASGTTTTVNPLSVAAVSEVSPDGTKASALFGALVSNQAAGTNGTQDRRLPVKLDLVRQGADWKVSAMQVVNATP